MKKRTVAFLLALLLVITAGSFGTMAYLYQETSEVKNTFAIGDVNISLSETTGNTYNYVPGATITKDPTVKVWNSVASYVFIKVVVANNSTSSVNPVLSAAIADGWTAYTAASSAAADFSKNGTYYFYREQAATTATQSSPVTYAVLKNNTVSVSANVTKDMVSGLTSNKPTITVQAAIVQKDNLTLANAFAQSGLTN